MKTFKQWLNESSLKYQKQEYEHAKIWHHSSPHGFDSSELRPMSHFGTSKAARARATSLKTSKKTSLDTVVKQKKAKIESNVISARLKLKKGINLGRDLGENFTAHEIAHRLYNLGHLSDTEHEKLIRSFKSKSANPKSKGFADNMQVLATHLKSKNIDHLKYKNDFEDPGSTSIIVVDPKETVRTVFQNKQGMLSKSRGAKSLMKK